MDETKKQPKVIVFSTPTCSYPQRRQSYFRQKGVKYRDVDVSRIPAAARHGATIGQQGVPVIDIGGKVIVGFDRPKSTSCSASNRPAHDEIAGKLDRELFT